MRDETTSSSLQMNQAPYLIMHNPQDALNGIDLFYLIAEFYKKRWLIISITTLCTLLSLAVVYFIPPQYPFNSAKPCSISKFVF
jgi:LPS O-antigen subunit length determinant protein (WzzB/FepE family)